MTVQSIVRELLSKVLRHFEYELKPVGAPLRNPREFLAWLCRSGFHPATVFDVGVADGTPWLYDSFPQAYFVLVEANKTFEPTMKQITSIYRGEHHVMSAGAARSKGILKVNVNHKSSSSLFGMSDHYTKRLEEKSIYRNEKNQEVDIRPLDEILTEQTEQIEAPFLLKMDVEGYEIEVLKGSLKILENTEVIISEISVSERMLGETQFANFIGHLDKIGFDFFDIIDMSQLVRGGRLTYLDAVFVKRGSFLQNL